MKLQIGDRVRLTGPMRNDPDPVPVGTEGTVDWIGMTAVQVCGVKWDNGRRLILLDCDPFEVQIARLRARQPVPRLCPGQQRDRRGGDRGRARPLAC
jgi:hypothetical protein